MNKFLDEYLCKCEEEVSLYNFRKEKDNRKRTNDFLLQLEEDDQSIYLNLPSQGRQVVTRWKWSYPKQIKLKTKTFFIKYEKRLSTVDKILLTSFKKKFLYHAIDDIIYSLKEKPFDQNKLLAILYSPVLSLQNYLSIDFFDIWIDEISITEISKANRFLDPNTPIVKPFSYITIKLLYTNKLQKVKQSSLW